MTWGVAAALAVLLTLVALAVAFVRGRRRATWWLDRTAHMLGVLRRPGESDEALRERIRCAMAPHPSAAVSLRCAVVDMLAEQGHHVSPSSLRVETYPAECRVVVAVSADVPAYVLREVEALLVERRTVPLGCRVEVRA